MRAWHILSRVLLLLLCVLILVCATDIMCVVYRYDQPAGWLPSGGLPLNYEWMHGDTGADNGGHPQVWMNEWMDERVNE